MNTYKLKINEESLQKDLESICEYVRKKESEKRAYFVKKAFEALEQIPEIEGCIVVRTANDYFGRSWERGLTVEIKNKKDVKIEHNADVSYQHWFPHTQWKSETDKTLKEQLGELLANNTITIDDIVIFRFKDYKDKTYDRSYTIEIQIKDLIPYLAKTLRGD